MNNKNKSNDDCSTAVDKNCGGRREFIVKATAIAGGLALSLSGLGGAATAQKKTDQDAKMPAKLPDDKTASDETVLKLDADSPLAKVGGSQTIETKAGKVIVVRTAAETYIALSAICTHKGGPIKYDAEKQQLFCPWHNSRFDADGKVIKPPAKTGLTKYTTEEAVLVNVK
ncbi:MAG: Rieske (2Fe-2S) protein [Acidobacteriota bacterium]|nr:Rieske (2Fe-2S) protein [Acidobacteriota bacterium]